MAHRRWAYRNRIANPEYGSGRSSQGIGPGLPRSQGYGFQEQAGEKYREKVDVFMIAHNQTLAALDEQKEATVRAEKTIAELREVKLKQKEWYEE